MKINFSTISERLADTFGDREALVQIETGHRYSFREFHVLTNRIVNMMQSELHLKRGDVWAVMLDNNNAALLHFFTAMKGAATACYCNYRDSVEEHARQLDQVDVKAVFIEKDLLDSHYEMLRARQITIVCMDEVGEDYPGVHFFWDLLEGVSEENPNVVHEDRKDVVTLRFTGGTTGQGKCAMYSVDNWMMSKDCIYAMQDIGWTKGTRVLHLAPVTHASGMLFLPSIFKGACTVTMNTMDLNAWCDNIAAENITTAMMVPTLLYRLLEMGDTVRERMKTVDTMVYGASPMSPSKLVELQALLGNIFMQGYASTEHVGTALAMAKADHLPREGKDNSHLGSAGRAVPGVETIIVDEEGNVLPRGEQGELLLRSRAICLGYFGDQEATDAEFRDGFWMSGDIARMDENGFVHILDRRKDMIITGGFNVYASEVEAAINGHPAVFMSAVIGIPDEEWGESVHAEVMLKADETLAADELKTFVRDQLGGYKTPKSFEFVPGLPTSVVGKVLRRQVREKYWTNKDRKVG